MSKVIVKELGNYAIILESAENPYGKENMFGSKILKLDLPKKPCYIIHLYSAGELITRTKSRKLDEYCYKTSIFDKLVMKEDKVKDEKAVRAAVKELEKEMKKLVANDEELKRLAAASNKELERLAAACQ